MMMMKPLAVVFAVTAASVFVGGAAFAQAAPAVLDAWARPTVQGQNNGGGYLRIDNGKGAADRLLGASAEVATSVELHSMTMEGDVMRMRKLDAIDVPAGGTVELKPGGLHLMLMGLKAPLAAGASFPITLKFEKAGEVKAQAKVAPCAADKGHDHHH